MNAAVLPNVFVWTKIQADAGQSVDRILRRKELERQAGGTFWRGIGDRRRRRFAILIATEPQPTVLLSLMLSTPHWRDSDPDGVFLWEAYQTSCGDIVNLPPHAVVISRAHDSKGNQKSRYYALVCASPTGIPSSGRGTLNTGMLRNYGGGPIGRSQITAVVELGTARCGESLSYPITARATLIAPYAVKLAAPRLLSPHDRRLLDEVSLDGKIAEDWMAVAKQLRRAGPHEQSRPVEQNSSRATIVIPRQTKLVPNASRLDNLVTRAMRHYAETEATDHFGFSGFRAAMACLYARPQGATQAEVNRAAKELGSTQSGYFNMLRQAKQWNHKVVVWEDFTRHGKIYKLSFNPNHDARRAADPPGNWKELNLPKAPPGVALATW